MDEQNPVLTTPLFDLHNELGAKMVPFAGYQMPVQYPAGIMQEHRHTRDAAGLFDVSHMGQLLVQGENAVALLETVLPIDVAALAVNQQSYALMTNDQGGIRDDLIICRWAEDTFFLVVNAACKVEDTAYLREKLEPSLKITELNDQALLALQGPKAIDVMRQLAPASNELTFMHGCKADINLDINGATQAASCFITRSGYTGEDGFEISIANVHASALAKLLLSYPEVEPIGLGARDSLRLEAGLCLYGHDMDATTSPIEATLMWSISKSRRADGDKAGGFPGADTVFEHIANGAPRKRVGLSIQSKAPVREGAEIVTADGKTCGVVCSGGFGPTINAPIAMGLVATEFAKTGTELTALVRGRSIPVTVTKMPFTPPGYFRG